ncbi:methyltransferase [Streptomyces sp. GMR22]|uniref:methyltransferase n=1 Tax=Streptomyces sp. GMR22 TaxID=2759524 RepID=UPI0015F97D9B|nr:methyltransferase [Streptomyces sp. GMR22]MBA6439094.1 methyltransferase domain-containing protein [Streptomyces sp. GMR22]
MDAFSDSESNRIYERFQLIVNGPALFNAVVTGLELDVFKFLADNPKSNFEEIQRFTGLGAHQLRTLLLALCATELIDKQDGRFQNSSVAETMLGAETPESWRNTLIGWREFQYPAFPHTTTALRTGENTALSAYPGQGSNLYARLAHDPEMVARYHESIAPFTHLFVTGLLDHPELASVRHLLDVGGGDGTTAAHFARRHPHARVTIFDMPSVTRHAGSLLDQELSDRVRMQPGDLFADRFPEGVDGVLFSHVLEPFSREQCLRLLRKAFDALPPGGRIFAYGLTAPDDESSGLLAARLSLYLTVLVSGVGMAHPAKDYASWLSEVGCADVRSFTGLPYEHGLIVGTKK